MKKSKQKQQFDIDNIVLDEYEQEIEKALERGDYVPVSPEELEKIKKILREAKWVAKSEKELELQKTKSITLRVKQKDLFTVQAKAKENNMPYQRLISILIHQYAEGKTSIIL